jgi:predicted O-methyltransferase YrrM
MSQKQWTAVDQYITDLMVPQDAALKQALKDSASAQLPGIQVTPVQGKFLQVLALTRGARRILEIGTLGGYSAICMARALLKGGKLITLEADERHAAVARKNIARAGLSRVVEIRLGLAADSLAHMLKAKERPFDLIFIDADKESLADYFTYSLKLSRPGTLIIADNVVRKGKVLQANSRDSAVQGVRRMNHAVAREKRVQATTIQLVGAKGYDGMMLAVVV